MADLAVASRGPAMDRVVDQVVAAGLTASIGVTPMIGINDVNTEIFQLSDAQMLLNFANSNSYITRLSMWSVARDTGSCPTRASPLLFAAAFRRATGRSQTYSNPSPRSWSKDFDGC